MTDSQNGTIHREMFIAADPAVIFAFFTDPDKMTRWMGVRCDLDPRPGGVYLVDVNHQNVARSSPSSTTGCRMPPWHRTPRDGPITMAALRSSQRAAIPVRIPR